jgi:2-keto-4-pentenoate hydratase
LSSPVDDERVRRGLRSQLDDWRKRLEGGERRLGWKIGFNLPAVQERLGISGPVIGNMTSANAIPSGSRYSLSGGTAVAAEAAIAVHVGPDGTITALAPALEIVDMDLPLEDLELILSRNVFHKAVILGSADAGRAGGNLDGLTISLVRNGEKEHQAEVASVLGDLGEIVSRVAELLEVAGERMEAGDVIITGALAIVLPSPGDTVEADFGPFGTVAASFT